MASPQEAGDAALDLDEIQRLVQASSATQQLSDEEQEVLKLWDQLQETQLECAFLQAQENAELAAPGSISESDLQAALQSAEKAVLQARGTHAVRQQAIQSVLVADPTLKAVHGGATDSNLQRYLPSRDTLGLIHSHLSSRLAARHSELASVTKELQGLNKANAELASQLVTLATELKDPSTPDELAVDGTTRAKLEELGEKVATARRRWRVMKSLVSGVVAGSGVDWGILTFKRAWAYVIGPAS
ncbi:hypothetical protein EJ06DRAFT_523135 [Trichodelitschia bisporula]|uniref:Centromere protein H C-terminal domain-containing protein n=1 Tax=Trichodelitschia bisporula TaxID=703511 RepID=A0A6G1HQF4_9PEZI|nr:hypothetical protein EJ06DRAFT_523135 [Trichodelitschia bisporula]